MSLMFERDCLVSCLYASKRVRFDLLQYYVVMLSGAPGSERKRFICPAVGNAVVVQ
jgi:hypothetical protein